MVWVMVDIGPIMAVMVMVDGPIMAVMVMVVILQLRTFNKRTARKQRQNHRPTIGTTAAIRKAIIPMSRSVQTAGYRWPRSQPHQL